jgi:hypothetical protein
VAPLGALSQSWVTAEHRCRSAGRSVAWWRFDDLWIAPSEAPARVDQGLLHE